MSVEVVDAGPLTTVQTPGGRPGWERYGVPAGGAADPWSALLANRLVGNVDDAPLLEATLAGPELRFRVPSIVAVTGARWAASVDGMPLPHATARRVRAGSALRVGGGDRARAYVAIAGLYVEPVLGSAATDLRSGFGGLDGRALRAGDRLALTPADHAPARQRPVRAVDGPGPIRIVPAPHTSWLDLEAFAQAAWRVAAEADRAGVRLDGPTLQMPSGGIEIPSAGVALGAIQVPPDGRPIVMLADRPVTGGYPVPACVIRADVGRVAQLVAGDEVRLRPVSVEEAIAALRHARAAVEVDRVDEAGESENVGWAGALE